MLYCEVKGDFFYSFLKWKIIFCLNVCRRDKKTAIKFVYIKISDYIANEIKKRMYNLNLLRYEKV